MPSPGARAALALALAAALPTAARAGGPPAGEEYEQQLIAWALAARGLERDPAPAGKVIERIEIAREDVISADDPWPSLLNLVHATTRDSTVRQELLVAPGERWDEARVEESARNLRGLFILAVVRWAACRGSADDKVVLLFVTKDLWSIRLNSRITQVGSIVQVLDLQPAEQNLLGLGHSASLHLRAQQLDLSDGLRIKDKAAIGQTFTDPRLFGGRVALNEAFDLLLAGAIPCGGRTPGGSMWCPSRAPGSVDGFAGSLDLSRPLFSLATEWAFDANASVNVRQVRRYVDNGGAAPPGQVPGLALDTVGLGDPAIVAPLHLTYLPQVYDVSELSGQASAVRSFGTGFKHDLGFGIGGYRHRYTPPLDFPFDPGLVQRYAAASLPNSEDAAYAFVSWRERDTRFVRLHDLQAFALSEDWQLGHDVSLTVQGAANLSRARQGFGTATLRAQYRWYVEDDLLTVWAGAQTRWQPHLWELGKDGPWADQSLELGVRDASPRFWIGRLHAQLHFIARRNDLDRTTSSLGGDTGLRGFPSNAFAGPDLLTANLEFRSEPVNLRSLHLGFAVFADGGMVFGPDPRNPGQDLPLRWNQSAGVGLRAQFPQFDKSPLRADLGIPLSGGSSVGSWFSLSFAQVF